MKCKFLAHVAATGLAVVVLPSLAAGQEPPPMGGGYERHSDPGERSATKAIAGALSSLRAPVPPSST